ncbi:hypothetical protein [Massilioclostridium coli]|uniref:hypothetical protein n=1 Tax=Massilioclostridium coli TaxID=1870991 RepID=UPI00085CBE65|nr:hypothetical protein [Massilioclostridium coli]
MKKILMAMVAGILSACMVTGCSTVDTKGWETYNIGDKVHFQLDPSWDIDEDKENNWIDCYIETTNNFGQLSIFLKEKLEWESVGGTIQLSLQSFQDSDGEYKKGWPVEIGGKTAFHIETTEYDCHRYTIALDDQFWVDVITMTEEGTGQEEVKEIIDQVLDSIRFS